MEPIIHQIQNCYTKFQREFLRPTIVQKSVQKLWGVVGWVISVAEIFRIVSGVQTILTIIIIHAPA